ncbi:MAG: carbonic anhydrase [Thermoleophilia bacterium]
MSKKRVAFHRFSGLLFLFLALIVTGCGSYSDNQSGPGLDSVSATTGSSVHEDQAGGEAASAMTPAQAQQALNDGNGRFVREEYAHEDIGAARRQELATWQHPFAVVVTCSDSRVPPELIFDQGLGDVFVVRVAGNVIDADALGSVEYAVEHLRAPLVMVMGHEECGAVKAAIEGGPASAGITSILQKIAPSVDKSRAGGLFGPDLLEAAIKENVRSSVNALEASPVLEEKLQHGELKIVSGEYMLGTGVVANI